MQIRGLDAARERRTDGYEPYPIFASWKGHIAWTRPRRSTPLCRRSNGRSARGSIMRLGKQGQKAVEIETVPTGSLGLDIALGVGGLPRGRVIEIYGPESSGKTTLTLHVIAEAQKKGGVCAFVDAEHALDPVYARKLGVNLNDLLISQPDTGEQALEITDTLVRSGAVDVLVIDFGRGADAKGRGSRARNGRLAARLAGAADEPGAAQADRLDLALQHAMVIFINQIRMKIGVMYGSPETTSGGNALKFYASVRLDIRRIGAIKEREQGRSATRRGSR